MKIKLVLIFIISAVLSCSDSSITGINQADLVNFNLVEFRYNGSIHEIHEVIEFNNYKQDFFFQDTISSNNYHCGYDIDSSYASTNDTVVFVQKTPHADTITRITFKLIADENLNVLKFLRIEHYRDYYFIIGPHYSYASGRIADTIELINVPYIKNHNEISVHLNRQEFKSCVTYAKYIKYHLQVDNDNGLGSSKSYMHDIISLGIIDFSKSAELILKLRKK